MISVIYARAQNYCIGKAGKLPWHLPDEYQYFEDATMGKPVIMGRKTHEDHDGILQGRLNIVVTSKQHLPGVVTCASLDEATNIAQKVDEACFVIGGANLIDSAIPLAHTVHETVVDTEINGDTFIAPHNFDGWDQTVVMQHPKDASHEFSFTISRYCRIG